MLLREETACLPMCVRCEMCERREMCDTAGIARHLDNVLPQLGVPLCTPWVGNVRDVEPTPPPVEQCAFVDDDECASLPSFSPPNTFESWNDYIRTGHDNVRYRTRYCTSVLRGGKCPHKNCWFAHSAAELRPRKRS